MKVYLLLTFALTCCSTAPETDDADIFAREQMETKVQEVITQLQNDCDSSLLLTAKAQADSIRKTRKLNRSKPGQMTRQTTNIRQRRN